MIDYQFIKEYWWTAITVPILAYILLKYRKKYIAKNMNKTEKKYKRGAELAGISFLLILTLEIFNMLNTSYELLFYFLILLCGIPYFLGCYYMAKEKGYHGAWALLGLLNLIGLVILYLLPNQYKKKSNNNIN